MADIKVSEMAEATQVNDDDLLMIVQNDVSKKAKASKIRKQITLFEGESSDVTLTDDVSNYDYIEIFGKGLTESYTSVKVFEPNNKKVCLITVSKTNNNMTHYLAVYSVVNNKITLVKQGHYNLGVGNNIMDAGIATTGTDVVITKVLGIKK